MNSDVEMRARLSAGISGSAIYAMTARALSKRKIQGTRIVDVGCGRGNLYRYLYQRFDEYVGLDIVRYPGLPAEVRFLPLDLNSETLPLPDACADVAVAVEVIEH